MFAGQPLGRLQMLINIKETLVPEFAVRIDINCRILINIFKLSSSKNTVFHWTVEKVSKRLEAKAERIISQKPIKIRREEKSDKTGLDKQRE